MKRSKHPPLSVDGEQALAAYTQYLQQEQDLRPATQRSYLSELRLFIAWYEHTWSQGQEAAMDFTPSAIATPAVTQYRSYLLTVLRLKPTTINRCLVGLKRYFAWAAESGVIPRDPARVVKLLPLPTLPPRHLSDQEENALMAAVTTMAQSEIARFSRCSSIPAYVPWKCVPSAVLI
jgi:site-specific recombinase XerD